MKTTIIIILSLIAINLNSANTKVPEKEFFLEDEKYINDIPFSTYEIAAIIWMEEAMAVEFNLEEEKVGP